MSRFPGHIGVWCGFFARLNRVHRAYDSHVNITTFHQPVLFYIDGGSAPTVFLDAFFASFGPSTDITLIGDLIDCTVSACAAIAQ